MTQSRLIDKMDCDICNRTFREGCLIDVDAVPYVTFTRSYHVWPYRMYAGKIVARGATCYRIATPGGTQHLVKFHRVHHTEPRLFNPLMRSQCAKKSLFVPEINLETYTTVYYDFQVFGDI